MTTIHLPLVAIDAGFWPRLAQAVSAALRERRAAVADTVVLLPHAELLAPARAAFAALGGWQPRIETTHTLADALGPPPARDAGAFGGERVADALRAGELLRSQPWAESWARDDPRAFEQGVDALVDAAAELSRAAASRPRGERAAWWALAREHLSLAGGVAHTEHALARLALEWVALDDAAASDRWFAHRPAAWVVVPGAGDDDLVAALARSADVPVIAVHCCADPARPFDAVAALPPPRRVVCDDFEAEAEAAAAEVLRALDRGAAPVALIALDRALVRRIHAMLEHVPRLRVHDETGWRLSTTGAAARVMALLRAAAPDAGADDWLDAMKLDAALAPAVVDRIEAAWRRGDALDADATAAWQSQRQRLGALAGGARAPLSQWLRALADVIGDPGDDPAARQVAAALRLDVERSGAAWREVASRVRVDRAGFVAWVDGVLDAEAFRPPAPSEPQVVITPLARALWRPFAAVVCPGADDAHLGAAATSAALWSERSAAALGLDHAARRREREARAFAELLRAPELVLLRRRSDAGEPRGVSVLVERAWRAARRAGVDWPDETPAVLDCTAVAPQPPARPAPRVALELPQRLSASAVEALRECPYRFFARSVLGLREVDEIDAELEKRDYGTWLHALLLRFHRERVTPRPPPADTGALRALADAIGAELGLDAARLLPYRAAFDDMAPRYVDWLQRRDAGGWRWGGGEVDRERAADGLLPFALAGRIDRIDRGPGGTVQLIDYKTGDADALARRVREPLEDTQLAVYAALVAADAPAALEAIYLALDGREAPREVPHPDVAATAGAFVEGLAADWRELRGGAALPALGEPPACDHCEYRGLCRRDHWRDGA